MLGMKRRRKPGLSLVVFCQFLFLGKALIPQWKALAVQGWMDTRILMSSSSSPASEVSHDGIERNNDKNSIYIGGLMETLGSLCDKYIMSGSPKARERVFNVLDQIATQSVDDDLVRQSIRMVQRAGVPMEKTYLEKYQKELGATNPSERRKAADERRKWEQQRTTSETGSNVANNIGSGGAGRSALSRREVSSSSSSRPQKPDNMLMSSVLNPDSIATIANGKSDLEKEMNQNGNNSPPSSITEESVAAAAMRVSSLVATAGAGSSFDGETLGIGGLDDVLAQVKRRVWTPLAAPPQLLAELGIHPVRGLLLYGKPGCGKTLLARTLGEILSPMRPITVVSGPEIMDKFVGSSEKNLREIFDNPPDVYDTYRLGEADGGDAIAQAALHVVVMDEFDAVARTRGGRDGKGGQGDAGVARDSVVNQLLAKMDGVQPLPVPTLVIGLTNKRSLVEPALLRPGRFEVQVEVPPPRSMEQRMSILKVHTKNMHAAGRLLVRDPPVGTAAANFLENHQLDDIVTYEQLLLQIAAACEGFSGAALAGVARAAASHALERAVNDFAQQVNGNEPSGSSASIMDTLVRVEDFLEAIVDVQSSMGSHDHSDDEDNSENSSDNIQSSSDDNVDSEGESP